MPPDWQKRRDELHRAGQHANEQQEKAALELQQIIRPAAGAESEELRAARAGFVEAQGSYFAALLELTTFLTNEQLFAHLYADDIRAADETNKRIFVTADSPQLHPTATSVACEQSGAAGAWRWVLLSPRARPINARIKPYEVVKEMLR